ncbi:MAG TPA: tRNA pseudouridine(38-40) synthase TruA [Candidatus Anaerostipes avistercoris]|uniref:tRNA pseudouridine synthase A n=1 Tax=Candidatus Anaerostipes avistercoris TaxID=2838462 RepID=A0A9D2PIZ2_9FIRM|nr:tRNA pseudouridine(38-40) synthase TruA [uncultured Anaerostipes sp.]HJC51572.1 tRNA pseudouridine(38-40) synthase TruA [Candidatus Anaerostipes avistercoris]
MKRNIRLLIEYDGARYRGWQKQGKNAGADTIQGRLEQVLSKMTGEDVQLIGSGRTDAGVHALGQVANFHTDCGMSCGEIRDYLTRYLPADIGILKVSDAGERFHSRLNAAEKTYCYRIAVPGVSHVFDRKYLWHFPEPLDIQKMEQAASFLIGTHDFKGFSSIRRTKKSTVRELYAIEIEKKEKEILISFTGNGFLHNMVRILTGTLAEVGCGKKKPEDVLTVFQTKDRQDAGMTAPPQGLFLVSVKY